MNKKLLFYIIIFGIAVLLIAISTSIYLIIRKEKVIENYDCYILSISWAPTTCQTKVENKSECFDKIKKLKDDKYFTLHGLWPTYLSGKNPDSCNEGKDITPDFDDDKQFKSKLEAYWPGLYSDNKLLWTKEYNEHGYCFIKRSHYNIKDDYKKYFKKAVNIFEKGYRDLMEQILPDSKGEYRVSKEKFHQYLLKRKNLNLTKDNYYLICDEIYGQLEEIRFVYDLNFLRTKQYNFQDNCEDTFYLNFIDEEKAPVHEKYDCYVFALSYGANTCIQKGERCYNILKSKENNKFIIHGLWPSYKNGVLPQDCNIDIDIEIDDNNEYFIKNVRDFWYSLYTTDKSFWTHEYNTHGFCYIKRINGNVDNYLDFFEKTMDIYNKNNFSNLYQFVFEDYIFPGIRKVNKTFFISKIEERYGKNTFNFTCHDNNFLNEIKFKLDMNFDFTSNATVPNDCPEEFFIEIMDGPDPAGKTNENIWKTYDVYMYSIFFQTGTCKSIGYQCYQAIENFPKNIWTIHGLWPNFKNGTIPTWCHGENDIEIQIKNESLYNYMKEYFRGLYRSDEGFWKHEYNRHGYCYNQRNNIDVYHYEEFFLKVVEIYKKYDLGNIFLDMYNQNLPKGDILITKKEMEKFLETKGLEKGNYLLICNNNVIKSNKKVSFIMEMRIRIDLDFKSFYKNETEVTKDDCPDEFYVEFL